MNRFIKKTFFILPVLILFSCENFFWPVKDSDSSGKSVKAVSTANRTIRIPGDDRDADFVMIDVNIEGGIDEIILGEDLIEVPYRTTVSSFSLARYETSYNTWYEVLQWAKENANASGLIEAPVRWLVDDCLKFVKREIRRGNKYDAVIMDPPSYGRGPDGEVWKLEQQLAELLTEAGKLLSDNAVFFFLNSYTGGLSPTILNYMVKRYVVKNRGGEVSTDEIGLYVSDKGISLPAGNTTIWTR